MNCPCGREIQMMGFPGSLKKMRNVSNFWTFLSWKRAINHMALCPLRNAVQLPFRDRWCHICT